MSGLVVAHWYSVDSTEISLVSIQKNDGRSSRVNLQVTGILMDDFLECVDLVIVLASEDYVFAPLVYNGNSRTDESMKI